MSVLIQFFHAAIVLPNSVPCGLELLPNSTSEHRCSMRFSVGTQIYLIENINVPQVRDRYDAVTDALNKAIPKTIRDEKHRGRITLALLEALLRNNLLDEKSMGSVVVDAVKRTLEEEKNDK